MHILQVTRNYPSEEYPQRGTWLRTRCRALRKCGQRVTVIQLVPRTPDLGFGFFEKINKYSRLSYRTEVDDGIKVIRKPYIGYPNQSKWGPWAKIIELEVLREMRKLHKPDIIHGHTLYPIGKVVTSIGRKKNIPSFITAHGGDVYGAHGTRKYKYGAIIAARCADEVITVSKYIGNELKKLANRKGITNYIGINIQDFEKKAKKNNTYSSKNNVKNILYVGDISKKKGVQDMFEALKRTKVRKKINVKMVGEVKDRDLFNQLKFGFESCDLEVMSAVSRDEIAGLMKSCDLFVLPSYGEGLPTVVVEAGVFSCPVIASRVGGIPEIIDDGHSGILTTPGSVSEIKRSVESIVTDERKSKKLGSNLNKKVRQNFSSVDNARKLLGVFNRYL